MEEFIRFSGASGQAFFSYIAKIIMGSWPVWRMMPFMAKGLP
jgi:hypothetical protein